MLKIIVTLYFIAIVIVMATSVSAKDGLVQLPDGTWVQKRDTPQEQTTQAKKPTIGSQNASGSWFVGSQDDCILQMTSIHNTMVMFKDSSIQVGNGSMTISYPEGRCTFRCENGILTSEDVKF